MWNRSRDESILQTSSEHLEDPLAGSYRGGRLVSTRREFQLRRARSQPFQRAAVVQHDNETIHRALLSNPQEFSDRFVERASLFFFFFFSRKTRDSVFIGSAISGGERMNISARQVGIWRLERRCVNSLVSCVRRSDVGSRLRQRPRYQRGTLACFLGSVQCKLIVDSFTVLRQFLRVSFDCNPNNCPSPLSRRLIASLRVSSRTNI